jgi:hypothetical protein
MRAATRDATPRHAECNRRMVTVCRPVRLPRSVRPSRDVGAGAFDPAAPGLKDAAFYWSHQQTALRQISTTGPSKDYEYAFTYSGPVGEAGDTARAAMRP